MLPSFLCAILPYMRAEWKTRGVWSSCRTIHVSRQELELGEAKREWQGPVNATARHSYLSPVAGPTSVRCPSDAATRGQDLPWRAASTGFRPESGCKEPESLATWLPGGLCTVRQGPSPRPSGECRVNYPRLVAHLPSGVDTQRRRFGPLIRARSHGERRAWAMRNAASSNLFCR